MELNVKKVEKKTVVISEEMFTLFSHLQPLFTLVCGLLPRFAGKKDFWLAKKMELNDKGYQVSNSIWIVFNSCLGTSIVYFFTPWGEIAFCRNVNNIIEAADLTSRRVKKLFNSKRQLRTIRMRRPNPNMRIIEIDPNDGKFISRLRDKKRPPAEVLKEWQVLSELLEMTYRQNAQRT